MFISVPATYAAIKTTTPNPPDLTIASVRYPSVKYSLKDEYLPIAINPREMAKRRITRNKVLLDTLVEIGLSVESYIFLSVIHIAHPIE